MLYIVFRLGPSDYAIEAAHVAEIVPAVSTRPCPGAPAYVTGLFNYRGAVVPVIDLGLWVAGAHCPPRLSTRLILTPCHGPRASARLVALLAESVTETLQAREEDFDAQGVHSAALPFLNGLRCEQSRMIQRIRPERLMPPDLLAALMPQEGL